MIRIEKTHQLLFRICLGVSQLFADLYDGCEIGLRCQIAAPGVGVPGYVLRNRPADSATVTGRDWKEVDQVLPKLRKKD